MKEKIILLILFILLICLLVVCFVIGSFALLKNKTFNHDFVILSVSKFSLGNSTVIFVHRKTKVMYCSFQSGDGCGLTIMLNPDGTPMVYDGEL